jgi:hypothetical protein
MSKVSVSRMANDWPVLSMSTADIDSSLLSWEVGVKWDNLFL